MEMDSYMRQSLKQSLILTTENRSLQNDYRESATSGLAAREASFSGLPNETVLPKQPQGTLSR
jgi:hypothetical protein